jgi:hypothetical protein
MAKWAFIPLGKRRTDVSDGLLALARQWLLGAFCHLGPYAKTVAGPQGLQIGTRLDSLVVQNSTIAVALSGDSGDPMADFPQVWF